MVFGRISYLQKKNFHLLKIIFIILLMIFMMLRCQINCQL